MVAYSGKQLKNTQYSVEKCNILSSKNLNLGGLRFTVELSWLHQPDPECEGSKFAGLYWSCLYIYYEHERFYVSPWLTIQLY